MLTVALLNYFVNSDKGKPTVSGGNSLAKSKHVSGHGSETEGVDDMLEAVVRSATSSDKTRERQRTKNTDSRKSCE